MIDQLKEKLKNLEIKQVKIKSKLTELEEKKAEEIKEIEEKYRHLNAEVTLDVDKYEIEVNNALIDSFIESIMKEFDAKRSTSEYEVTDEIKAYRHFIANVELFPKELIERLDKVIEGEQPIENLAYDIEKIKDNYMIS